MLFDAASWNTQSIYSKRLQLFIGAIGSTVVSGFLALAFGSEFLAAFIINFSLLVAMIAWAWFQNRRLVRVSSAKTTLADPPVPFIDLTSSINLNPGYEPLPKILSEDEAFVRQTMQELVGQRRSARRKGESALNLVPDQSELLRRASIQAKIRDRRRLRGD